MHSNFHLRWSFFRRRLGQSAFRAPRSVSLRPLPAPRSYLNVEGSSAVCRLIPSLIPSSLCLWALFLLMFLASGCSDARVSKVQWGVETSKRLLEKTKKDLPTAMSYNSAVEMGGSPVSFIAANIFDPNDMPSLIWQGPPQAFSVVIRMGSAPGEYIIEGYKEDMTKPAFTEIVQNTGSMKGSY